MRITRAALWTVTLATCFVIADRVVAAEGDAGLTAGPTIALDGVDGRFDHMAYDAEGHRLFIAALGNDTLEVIDTDKNVRLKQIKGLRKPTGIAVAAAQHRIAVASGNDGMCRIYDPELTLVATIDRLDDADNVRYDAASGHAFVGYGEGALAEIDVEHGKLVRSIPLKGHPEAFEVEATGRRIFVNVPDARHIAVIDRDKAAVVATWPVDQARANFPMELDEQHARLFIGCRAPARVLVYDTHSGHVVASFACCGDTDDLFYDAARRQVYLAGGEGCINVFTQTDPDHYTLAGTVKTASGARTMYYAEPLDRLFLCVPHRFTQKARIETYTPTGKR
ncbi:MAG: hypothetical protein GC159_10765 [Phycisphaera sp.]|nr:hypothetical protein [Phycisphaera sp.]